MANPNPLSFSDTENSSSVCHPDASPPDLSAALPDQSAAVVALYRLSANLGSLFQSDFCSDAVISVSSDSTSSPTKVPVHRCILSARSPFFRDLFSSADKKGAEAGAELDMRDLVKGVDVGVDSFLVVLGYLYTGAVGPFPKGVSMCADEEGCPHVACRPAVDFLLEVLYASFTFQIPELVKLFQRHLLDILVNVADNDLIVIMSIAYMCNDDCERLVAMCMERLVYSKLDVVTLEKTLPPDIFKQIMDSRFSLGLCGPHDTAFPDKHVKRIHRALDSDDVELVRMLLKEKQTTLDDAFALHYAVAHCDSKITTELLDLGLADVNHKNPAGYTVLHIAAMRKEPTIIVSLLTKGARPSDVSREGWNALLISKRVTRYSNYYRPEEGPSSFPKDRLCIEILENADRRNPLVGEASVSLAIAGDDLRRRLLYLETRVGLARFLFPREANIAMENAKVDGTLEFPLGTNLNRHAGSQRDTVDLNDAPFKIKEEHLARMRALSRTVELGKRYFPRCSKVIDEIMDDDTADIAALGTGDPLKKRKFEELQDVIAKAFSEDKEEYDRSSFSSSSSSKTADVRKAVI